MKTTTALAKESAPSQQAMLEELAAEMAARGTGRSEPVREVFGMLGDRWTTLILLVLATGEWRHAGLRRTLAQLSAEGRISQRVLMLKLRALSRNGFVHREATDDVPPHVSYSLTPLGHGLAAQARQLIEWVGANQEAILSARAEAKLKTWRDD